MPPVCASSTSSAPTEHVTSCTTAREAARDLRRPVRGDHLRRRLLQGFLGEQPILGLAQTPDGPPPRMDGLGGSAGARVPYRVRSSATSAISVSGASANRRRTRAP